MTTSTSHKKRSRIGKISAAIAALLMLTLAILAGIHFEKNTRISDVEFSGFTFSTEQELENAFESPVGLLADSVDFGSVFSSVRALPYVKDLSVRMTFRGVLTVEVEERNPIGLTISDHGQYLFDSEGIQLPVRPGHRFDVPLVYGMSAPAASDTLSGSEFEEIRNFLVAAKENPFAWASISEVAWNNRDGVIALSSENGVKLLFGKKNFNEKMTHWEAFYNNVVSRKGIESFNSIDLRFSNQIVADER